jgi:lysyl-tRNA synthetase class II
MANKSLVSRLNSLHYKLLAEDLRAFTSLPQKHKALEDEMMQRDNRFLSCHLAKRTRNDQEDRVRVVQGKRAMHKDEMPRGQLRHKNLSKLVCRT